MTKYTASSIRVLEGLEAVRKRPAMYIGSTGPDGLHHLVYEIVDNSVDEALAGHCSNISVILHDDGSCSVEDNGRGIPTDMHQSGISATEVVFTKLHAGGKFDKETYKFSGGLHGVGASVVNALSEWLDVTVCQNGKIYSQHYEYGKPSAPLAVTGTTDKHGTFIRFKPDKTIFQETIIFNFDTLSARLRELAFLNKGLRIEISDENSNKTHAFFFEGGIISFVEHINSKKTPLFTEVLYGERQDDKASLECALQYNDGYGEQLFSFVNNINTIDGGTHVAGFKAALTKACNKRGQEMGILKDNISLSSEDVREGLVAVINLKVAEPQFEGQTKAKLGNSDMKGVVESWMFAFLETYFEEHPAVARKILQKAQVALQAREAARKARELTRRKTVLESTILPGKLADCSSENPSETELYIVEGDSAGGSAKQARDRFTQAILPLRGKILNVEKARLDKILSNEEIKSLIAAIGTGFADDFNTAKARYHKIILMTDADVDGSHIRILLLTFFYRYMRPLIESGYVYIAQPPLYKVKLGKKEQYLKDYDDLKNFLLDWAQENTTLNFVSPTGSEEVIDQKEYSQIIRDARDYLDLIETTARNFKLTFEQCWFIHMLLIKHADLNQLVVSFEKLGQEEQAKQYALFIEKLKEYTGLNISLSQTSINYSTNPSEQETLQPSLTSFIQFNQIKHSWSVDIEFFTSTISQRLMTYYEKLEPFVRANRSWVISINGKDKTVTGKTLLDFLHTITKVGKPFMSIQRYKGLGEMNPEQLWETAMDPKNRSLLQVSIGDALEADAWFDTLMGDDVPGRRAFIEENGHFVKDLDV